MKIVKRVLDNTINKLNRLPNFNLRLFYYKDDYILLNNQQELVKGSSLNVYEYLQGMLYAIKSTSNNRVARKTNRLPKDIENFLELKKNIPIDIRVKGRSSNRNSYKTEVYMSISILSYNDKELEFKAKVYSLDDNEAIISESEYNTGRDKVGIVGVKSVVDLLERVMKEIDKKHIKYMTDSKENKIIWVDNVTREISI